jgi:hypothetical protein
MTIICTDGKTIAADGQETWDGVITSREVKKIHVIDGVIYAMTGASVLGPHVIDWARRGAPEAEKPKNVGHDEWRLVIIDRGGISERNSTTPYLDPMIAPPWAWGADAWLALGAMYAGRSPVETVRMICERTINAGGEIQVVDIAEALGLKPADKMQAAFEAMKARQEAAE